ncbi:YhcN/YlaJ family sporulation lipoprotein [Paenibacillus sp. IHBB 10380]|uniref:YhcN/YlaJ family sporulation lipoprotein n=1 Tax=Paenibacillus sp. IHBB 10380 TaxID=1566358 RepID=UPI0005CF9691|nr:YhcN/YlaJ family sporulation lipoprotein [Paenibacillus sp. IHBB 10380]AJS57466.1 hypothetical protein UB51_02005 [Paenibacillus sp. IHBB 10380]
MIRSKAINLSLSTALLVSMFGVAGCMTKEPANTNINTKNVRNTNDDRRIGVNSLRDGRDRLTTRNNTTMDQMTNLHVDRKLAAKIAAIKGVRSANVFLTDDNAYVAVSLDNAGNTVNNLSVGRGPAYINSANGINGLNGVRDVNNNVNGLNGVRDVNNNVNGLNGVRDVNNNVNGINGQYNSYRNDSKGNRGLNGTTATGSYGLLRDMTSDNNGIEGNGYRAKNIQNNNARTSNYHNKVTPLDNEGVRYNRSSTAVNNIPTEIRKQITSIVQKQVPGIKKVYASSDPDFVARLNTFATTYGTGVNNVNNTNLVTDFKKLVYRIFPMHDSTMDPDK